MNYTSEIGDRSPTFRPEVMQAIRQVRGLTREELAELAGLSKATIISYENGRCTPSSRALGALAAALAVLVSAFYRSDDDVLHRWSDVRDALPTMAPVDVADLARVLVRIDVRDALGRAS
jgi:transcriptional regulator with XRE-family HTH domain